MHALKSCLIAVCLVALAPALHATPLPIGSTVVPEALPEPGDVPILASTTGTFDFGSGPGHLTGSFEQGVLVDPFGLTCAGCLDFFYIVQVDALLQAGIGFVSVQSFRTFITNVGFLAGEGDKTPRTANRGSATPVGFAFRDPTGGDPSHIIGPGDSSAVLIIATDATAYDQAGSMTLFGGRDASQSSVTITSLFEPIAAVPEPAEWLLLACGVVGIARVRSARQARGGSPRD